MTTVWIHHAWICTDQAEGAWINQCSDAGPFLEYRHYSSGFACEKILKAVCDKLPWLIEGVPEDPDGEYCSFLKLNTLAKTTSHW